MGFKESGQVHVRPPTIDHKIKYWINEETKTVVYVWYNKGEAKIVEWDYSTELDENSKKTISPQDEIEFGEIIETYDILELDTDPFKYAVEQVKFNYDISS